LLPGKDQRMMLDETRPLLATIELEPIDSTRLRSMEGSDMWEIAKGKQNRIAIGYPQCLREVTPSEDSLLKASDLTEFPTNTHAFFRLNLALTLLPDVSCRFRSADFIIDFRQAAPKQNLPLILRLRPAEQASHKVIVVEEQDNMKLSLSVPTLMVVGPELGQSHIRREEVERIMVNMECFGIGTKHAGWRFRLTDSREIPLSSTDLEVLIVLPQNTHVTAQFSVVAEIDVLSGLDKWLTWPFKRKNEAVLQCAYEFPS
jgi:hypothetical protein